VIVDHDLKLVVLHIPKCAGTALRRAFLEDGAERRIESWFDFGYDPVLKRQVDLAHRPLMDLRHTQLWRWLRRYRVMACIRHPYDRLASACREHLRQKSRASEVQVRSQPPTEDQLLHYLRRLPAAMDAHDLRWVHGFPLHWFTHLGQRPMVDQLIRCEQLSSDLERAGEALSLPQSLRERLRAVASGEGRKPSADLKPIRNHPDLQALANQLHNEDFSCFQYPKHEASFNDPELRELIDACLAIGPSHDLPLTNLTPEMHWYYGRVSPKPPLQLKPQRIRRATP
jgi:hypothetical protein